MSEYLNKQTQSDEIIFALDIGTRSIVGIAGIIKDDVFEVLDYEQCFHEQRAMRDGQIEDINLVAKVVKKVKNNLELRLKTSFKSVAIAAAGRSLKTIKTAYEQDIDASQPITESMMLGYEYAAIGNTMDEFSNSDDPEESNIYTGYYCVGYTVINYWLDNYNMASLIGHKGKNIKIDLIAAFLPHNVVEGLYAVMKQNDLEIKNLTLEPMAAINVIVQKDIRLLNIAIVDIGAGTSDIAISKNGSIVAYDMVTIAGDEITEGIMGQYLTDFDTAERIKMSLNDSDKITFNDILGNEYNISSEEVYDIIRPSITNLADTICKHILDVNGHSPVAVFIVGGGSQINGLCEIISKNLVIPNNRVVVGGKQGLKYVNVKNDLLKSPEFVTPIGIGAILSSQKGNDFFSVNVNDKKVMLLSQGQMTVMDTLLLAGIKPSKLISNGVTSLSYYLNGNKKTLRPKMLQEGQLIKNGVSTSTQDLVNRGDKIVASPSIYEKLQKLTIKDVLKDYNDFYIFYNNKKIIIPYIITVNDELVKEDYEIKQFDKINIVAVNCLKDICEFLGLQIDIYDYYINDEMVDLNYTVDSGDMLIHKIQKSSAEEDLKNRKANDERENIFSDKNKKEISVFINGDLFKVSARINDYVTFVDLLNYVNIETKNPTGTLVLRLNKMPAEYTMPVKEGDIAEIFWDK